MRDHFDRKKANKITTINSSPAFTQPSTDAAAATKMELSGYWGGAGTWREMTLERAGVPIRVVAALHDTSAQMIERTYAVGIDAHVDAIVRPALIKVCRLAYKKSGQIKALKASVVFYNRGC